MTSPNTTTATATTNPAKSSPVRRTKATKAPAKPAGQLDFQPHKADDNDLRAKGAGRHAYRLSHTGGVWFAEQKGGSAWTAVGGPCTTQAEAQDLVQRYEGGARQLSHAAYRGLPYAEVVAKLAQ